MARDWEGLRKPFYEERETDILVGSTYSDGDRGPCARISMDIEHGWLYIVTDDYEGQAMIGLEAISKVRKALAKLERDLRKQMEK